MRASATIAALELRRRLRDRSVIIQAVVAPIVIAAIIGAAFGGGFSFSATVGIADQDGSPLSAELVGALVGLDEEDVPITFVAVDPDDPAAAVRSEEATAVIVIPDGFAEAATGGTDVPPLAVLADAGSPITADVTTSVARRIGAQVDLSRLVAASVLAAPVDGDETAVSPELVEVAVEAATNAVAPIVVEVTEAGEPYDPIAYFAPGMAMLFLFFAVGVSARSLISERRDGTLARIRAAPVPSSSVVVGKSGAVLVLGMAAMTTVWVVTSFVFGADWGDPVAVVAIIGAVVLAIAGVSVAVTGFARTDAQADGLTGMVAFGFALLGGSFLQPGTMPPLLAQISLFTPNGQALRAFTEVGAGGGDLLDVLPAIGVLVAMGLGTGLAGLAALSRRGVA
ncbi:MAG: ABC transporter permease [Acidimicrobiia bacterium]|nr:ABC transporter permease [Acidimicrobiia bacterium]